MIATVEQGGGAPVALPAPPPPRKFLATVKVNDESMGRYHFEITCCSMECAIHQVLANLKAEPSNLTIMEIPCKPSK